MQKSFRNGIVLVLLGAIALATWYLGHHKTPAPAGFAADGTYPVGYYLRDAVLLGTNPAGKTVYRISAALAQEAPGGAQLQLEDVKFHYQPNQAIPWTISAAHGTATTTHDGDIEFTGGVTLVRDPKPAATSLRIETEKLILAPSQYLATAPGAVKVSIGAGTLDAVGLKAFLKTDRLQLESQIHGLYTH